MDLRQLRSLVALAEEHHFTRAAAREHIAQPALSQQIRRLEEELGVALVQRTTRRVRLTDAGTLLVARARRILGEVEAARAEMEDVAGLRAGRVAIGAMQTLGAVDLGELLERFHAAHPHVELAVREEPSDTLATLVREGTLDVALVSLTDQIEREGLELTQLAMEDLVAFVPPSHALAGRRRVAFSALRDESFVAVREGGALRHLLFRAAAEAGFRPRILFESNELPRILGLVARGLAVAVMPRSATHATELPVVALDLVNPRPHRDVTLAWAADGHLGPAARAFLELARASAVPDAPCTTPPEP